MGRLDHIHQFHMKCEKGKKVDFIKKIFDTLQMTQTFVFVNNKDFCERLHKKLVKQGYAAHILFSKMSPQERDEIMNRFRMNEINVLICTDILNRGIDIPDAQLVINFDIPMIYQGGKKQGDWAGYMHRIGRCGRFGTQAIALSVYDTQDQEAMFKEICDFF